MTKDDDPADIFDDLDKLKADSAMPQAGGSGKPPSPRGWKRHGTFTPREWGLRLKKANRVSTFLLVDELLYQHWRAGQGKFGRKDGPVVISSGLTKAAGISMRSMGNALDELERLRLISVLRVKRRSPRAFPLHIPPEFWK